MSALLAADGLAVGYGARCVVAEGISVGVNRGELVCLIGPNGAGKSTLLRTLAGMQRPLAGRVTIGGEDLHALSPRDLARRIAVVLTERLQVGGLSALALVSLGRHPHTGWLGRLSAHDLSRVCLALEQVDAAALAGRDVAELSDGERQRVFIARALAQEPEALILDEPTAFLDLPRRVEVLRLLRNLAHGSGRAVVLSTHDLDLALHAADRIWLLPGRNERLLDGAPEDLVLSGAFGAAFRSEGVEFDPQKGTFRIHDRPAGRIALTAEGPAAVWAERAVERAGLAVAEDAAARLSVWLEDGAARWRLDRAAEVREGLGLGSLVALLRGR